MSLRSNEDLAELLLLVAKGSEAVAILCATEEGTLVKELRRRSKRLPILAATTNQGTYEKLTEAGVDTIRLPLYTADPYGQVAYMLSVALRQGRIAAGSLVVCGAGRKVFEEWAPLVLLTEVDPDVRHLRVSDLLKLTDAVQAPVLEATIDVACTIGRAARRGKRLGTIFTLGDSESVLRGSRQLVPNPFEGHGRESRVLTNREIHDSLVELAKLDGAFVVRGDGFIQAAGVFLDSAVGEETEIDIPSGLGTRHVAAAAVTARTTATAVVVSATDGDVRVFSGGGLVLRVDPEAVQRALIPTTDPRE